MKLLLLLLASFSANTVQLFAQDGFTRAGTAALGDYRWRGKHYREARAWVVDGFITVRSGEDGTVKIPVEVAPIALRKKLAIDRVPAVIAKPGFALLKAKLGEVKAHHGNPTYQGGSAFPPATKVLHFAMVNKRRLSVNLMEGEIGSLMLIGIQTGLTQAEATEFLIHCGGKWIHVEKDLYRNEDGAVAALEGGALFVKTAAFLERLSSSKLNHFSYF